MRCSQAATVAKHEAARTDGPSIGGGGRGKKRRASRTPEAVQRKCIMLAASQSSVSSDEKEAARAAAAAEKAAAAERAAAARAAAAAKLYEETDQTVIDRKLGPGAAASGWRIFEARPRHEWTYVSPSGVAHTNKATAVAARELGPEAVIAWAVAEAGCSKRASRTRSADDVEQTREKDRKCKRVQRALGAGVSLDEVVLQLHAELADIDNF